tara:strand:+ start:284 stop:529 length:246 start_codon:yes stop_codon:yes gene_type:complete
MSFNNRKWVIITLSDYNDSQLDTLINNALQSSKETLRKSLDESKAILKWDGNTPTVFDGMTTYNHNEILTILAGSEWSDNS